MQQDHGQDPPLSSVAEALETELRRYEQLALALDRERLGSEKSIARAARSLNDLQTSETRLGECVQALVRAITAARERQQAQAEAVQGRAAAIMARIAALNELTARWDSLGRDAGEVNQLAQRLLADASETNGSPPTPEWTRAFGEVEERIVRLADDARDVSEAAGRAEFADLAARAESLRVQLLGVLNKLRLLRTREE